MSTILRRTQRTMLLFVAALLGLSLLSPVVTLGQSSLVPGDTAVISAGGDNASLRDDASTSANKIGSIPDGTEVFIIDGPITGADGSTWYYAGVWDLTGYISASLLSSSSSAPAETAEEPAAVEEVEEPSTPSIPWKQPIDYGVVVDNSNAPLPGEGLACRADAYGSAEVLVRLGIGQSVEVVGQSVWSEGIEFLPINCGGQGGFVKADYVALNSQSYVEEEPAVEEPAAVEEEVVTQEEAPADAPVAGDLIVTVLDQNGVAAAGACFALYQNGAWVAEACDSNDAIPNNGNSGFFGVTAGAYTLVATAAPGGAAIDNREVWIDAGSTAYVTINVATAAPVETEEAAPEEVVTEEVVTEEVVTEEVVTEEVVTEEVVTEEVVTEEVDTEEVPTEEVVTEEPATEDVPTEEVPTEEATDEVVTEEVTEEVDVTEEATDVVTEEVTEEATEEATDEATEEVVTEEVTEEATEDVPTEEVTEEPTGEVTEVPTDEATEEATEEVTEEPTEEVTEEATEEPTEEATVAPGSDLGEPIGDATVTGTNGDGLRCRVAPDANSAVISVLPEGSTVFIYETNTDGYLTVGCAGQLGYADVNYLWSGGAGEEIPSNVSSVVVVGTGGMALNCRAGAGTSYGVVAVVSQGSVLTSRGASSNGWAPVVCNGKNGFVSISYVEASGGGSGSGTTNPGGGTGGNATAGTGTVTNTGGDGLRCRTSAVSGAVIVVLAEGTVVKTRGAASNGWVPVVCNGQNGFISAQYFTAGSTSGGGTTTPPTTTPAPGANTGYVKVTGTGGASLNCRTAASMSGMVITAIPSGSTVATRGASSNGWTPVTCGGKAGYVSSTYVSSTSGGGTTDPGTKPDPAPGSGATGTAVVDAGGDNLRCRTAASASASVITSVAHGTTVKTRGASSNGWTPVICGGQNGFMSSQFLSTGGGGSNPTPTPTPTPPPSSGSGMKNGDHGKVNSRANMRYQASLSANVMIVVEPGEVLLITGNATNGFYPVNYDGLKAFMSVDLLDKTSEALSKRGGSGNDPDPAPNPGGGGGSAVGNSLVNYAMRYIGYPYRSATHGPSSFDCSGFTYWVVKNVIGSNIGTGLWTQVVAGSSVSRGSLKPGDLVFFQNTYKAGLSHVGIYIGNDQFVHAENENTGVRVSSLSSTYYSSRWYGAVRLG